MASAACPQCGARYKVPDTAVGKRTTCRKCGAAFRIPAPASPAESSPADAATLSLQRHLELADLDALARGESVAAPRSTAAVDAHPARAEAGGTGLPPATLPAAPAEDAAETPALAYARYLRAAAPSLALLWKPPTNLITFGILWVALAMREMSSTAAALVPSYLGGGFLWVGWLIVTGWYQVFKMNVVMWAADGEEELPELTAEGDWWDGMLLPCLRMLATYVFALLPVLIFITILSHRMENVAQANFSAAVKGASPAPGSSALTVTVLLALLGLFVWPMMVLVVSGGSVGCLFRLDLMGETILTSFPAYLLAVLAVYASFAIQLVVTGYVWSKLGQVTAWQKDWLGLFGLPMLCTGITLYFDIVTMRAIGYYYFYFKHKFAWSWG